MTLVNRHMGIIVDTINKGAWNDAVRSNRGLEEEV